MSAIKTILEYFRLIRFSTVGNEAGVILLGGFMMGQRDMFHIFLLFIIGMLGHIYGYVLNEYVDVETDKKLKYDIKKPLVSGAIPKINALIISISAAILAFILVLYFYRNILSLALLLVAAVLTAIYDIYGKKIPFSDFIVAGTLGVFLLFGASTVSSNLPNVVFITALIFFFDVVFMNFVEGGLKDIDHDGLAGAKTMAIRFGVKVKENKLIIPIKFKAFGYSLRLIFFSLVFWLMLQPQIRLLSLGLSINLILVILLSLIVIFASYKLLHFPIFDKSKLYKLFTLTNSCSVSLLLIVLFPLLGIWVTIFLFLLPITWFVVFNYLLYKKTTQALV